MIAPKLFISYSWSSSDHEQWVINLATELRDSGVDVILDKWDLKEGHDAVAFMEQMVTNPEISKVAIISDETYASKADRRTAGVGTETQIISKEVYEKQDQEKFVVIVAEKNSQGKPWLPTYYKSRIYIDLSELDRYSENFEKLLRWIFDKPLYVKPEIGSRPSFLDDGEHISLGTTATFKRCVDALRNNKPYAAGAFDEYCNIFVANFERFRLSNPEGEFDDAVVRSIEEFLPFRNEVIQLLTTIAQYSAVPEFIQRIHRLFESLILYMERPEHINQCREWDFDNFRFLVHELFLYALAVFIKKDRVDQAKYILEQQYYVPGNSDYGKNVMVRYSVFQKNLKALDHRNRRLKLNRPSLNADLLKERCNGTGIEFRDLMQADFVAFMRSEISFSSLYDRWWPETLVFFGHNNSAFEIFARSVSKNYFDRVKGLLGIDNPKDLEQLLISYQDHSRDLPQMGVFGRINPSELLGYQRLATQP